MGKTKDFEVTQCECGNLCPVEYSYSNEDGSWTCGQCMVSELSHQIHARKGQKSEESTEALNMHGVINRGIGIPYDDLSDSFKKTIYGIEDKLNNSHGL